MNLTQLRQTIYAMGGGLVVTAGAAAVWSLGSLEPKSSVTSRPLKQTAVNDASSSDRGPSDQVAIKFDQPLQKSLYDPPKKPTKPPVQSRPSVKTTPVVRPPKPPKLDWTLLGTVIESGQSIAIIADASGKTDIRTIGEEVELMPAGVLVRKIDSEVVTLEVRGKESKLKLLKDFASSGNAASRNRRRNNR